MAALRDSVAWLKHGSAADGNPAPERLRWAYAYGRSQTSRLLRTLIYEDLNLDEQGREALDGIIANVAGGMRGEFNQRFGQHSKDRNHMMAHLFPFTDQPSVDPETGTKDALHARLDARGSRLRVFYTNTSAEYHRGDASLIHTDPDGARDADHGPTTRVYHFTGTEHGLGIWPPSDTQVAPADPTGPVERSQNLRSVADYSVLLRACLVNLDRWVVEGVEPPPSSIPRLSDGTLVPALPQSAAGFPKIPGVTYTGLKSTRYLLNYGPDFYRTGIMTVNPPVITSPMFDNPKNGKIYPTYVPKTDADGNDIAGVRLPDVTVPLATYTGCSLRAGPQAGDGCEGTGQMIPFAKTKAERQASGDPRPSIEERYPSFAMYEAKVRAAVEDMVSKRLMLREDAQTAVDRLLRAGQATGAMK